jgi:4-hydroxy-2-oxoheptanedioate aldolase
MFVWEGILRAGHIKEKLNRGETVIGTFVRSVEPAIPEVLALSGFDFIILDGEHSPLEIRSISTLIRAADGANIPAIVRVSENAPFPIMQALDVGASGIQVPQVNSLHEAKRLVAAAKYHPLGNRGLAATHRAAQHGFGSPLQYTEDANQNTLVASYIETKEAVDAVDAMVELEGIDVFFAGPFDLSQSYGVPGQANHADVQNALDRVSSACQRAGKAAGTIAASTEQAKALMDRGFRFLAYSSDLGLLAQAAQAALRQLRS